MSFTRWAISIKIDTNISKDGHFESLFFSNPDPTYKLYTSNWPYNL